MATSSFIKTLNGYKIQDSDAVVGVALSGDTLTITKHDGATTKDTTLTITHPDINGKADLASPAFTGTPTAPTAAAGTNTTQIATTAFVTTAVNNVLGASDAMVFKGTLGSGGTVTALPASHAVGDTYKVITAGTYAGVACEVGDMLICITKGTAANDAHWTVVQANIDGAVTGPASSTAEHIATFSGATGKVIKDSGYTIASNVPANAKFSDTTYSAGTGLTLDGTTFNHSNSVTAVTTAGLYKVKYDAEGHITGTTAVTKTDITGLGIPGSDTDTKVTAVGNHYTPAENSASAISASGGTLTDIANSSTGTQVVTGLKRDAAGHVVGVTSVALKSTNTTYDAATTSADGLMSAADKTKLDGIAANANNYSHPTGDGNLHVPATSTTNNGKYLKAGATAGSLTWGSLTKADVTTALGYTPPETNTTYSDFAGTTHGLVPASTSAVTDKVLRSNGNWTTVALNITDDGAGNISFGLSLTD